jgi:asparagine synthetase B (glutamine-hydrolysing)
MPGIVAVIGARDPEGVVRRAADPLLRRPTQRLSLASDVARGAALGFAGERGGVTTDSTSGVVVAFDGELALPDGPRTGAEAAEVVCQSYLDGEGSVPDGWFAAAVWDPRVEELSLITDAFGHRPVYVARRGGSVLAAGELKALLAAGPRASIDIEAWAEMLAYEFPLGSHTPLAGVRLVPAASTVRIRASGQERVDERWRYRLEPNGGSDGGDIVDEFGQRLEAAALRRLDASTALALSGGLDSRCLAAILAARAPMTVAASYGAPHSEDLTIGTKVAGLAGLPHLAQPLEPGYIARGAAETVWLAEGHVRCFHSHHLALRLLRSHNGSRSLLIGFGGDPVVRATRVPEGVVSEAAMVEALHQSRASCLSDDLVEELLSPSFAAQIRGLARASLARCLADEQGTPVERMRQFMFRQSHRRKVLPGSELFLDDLAPRDPFDDLHVVEFCRRMPTHWRAGGRLERAYVSRFPELAALPSPKERLAPRLTGRRRALALRRVRAGNRVRTAGERIFGTAWSGDRHGLGDYTADLRRASGSVLEILLEPRTIARGQLRREPVARLVRETLTGRGRHTRPLGMLLTFELFQRQFIDGEPPEL